MWPLNHQGQHFSSCRMLLMGINWDWGIDFLSENALQVSRTLLHMSISSDVSLLANACGSPFAHISKTEISSLTCGISWERRHLALRFLQFSLQSDVNVVHQMRKERQCKSYGRAVLFGSYRQNRTCVKKWHIWYENEFVLKLICSHIIGWH